ncbi:hypothetical protein ACFW1P_00940 [Paenibacillus sp. NPDC058910]|uniref:hypothetical protein n=1 Tax=unclassified Paenibacillus TaxID=185978 RepID=UPI000BF40C55|nr:hypothetical protein [Paenibacillus sp. EZ-K15]
MKQHVISQTGKPVQDAKAHNLPNARLVIKQHTHIGDPPDAGVLVIVGGQLLAAIALQTVIQMYTQQM